MAASPEEIEKKIRALRKKLGQIEKLREKEESVLDPAAREKIASGPGIRAEVEALEAQLQGGAGAAAEAPAQPAKPQKPATAPAATEKPAKAAAKAPAKAEPEPAEAASAPRGYPDEKQDKRIKSIKKKLGQIAKLKERGAGNLDAEAKEKVAAEAELLKEIEALERGEEYVPEVNDAAKASSPQKAADDGAAEEEEEPLARQDVHLQARAEALGPPPGDIGLLLDDDASRKFRTMQKKLRDIDKLHKQQDKLDKLQQEKLSQEGGLIEELAAIRAKATEKVAERKERMAAALAAKKTEKPEPKEKTPPNPNRPDWLCNECGATGKVDRLIGSEGAVACPKCGGNMLTHYAPCVEESSDDDDEAKKELDAKAAEAKEAKKHMSTDLKTARQKKPLAAVKRDDGVIPPASAAKWPEVKEILLSGEGGNDKGRMKKTIEVRRSKEGGIYNTFDQTLLRCSFLGRVELQLAPGVLSGDDFNLYFPGSLAEGLVELVLKGNELPMVPPGIAQLQRLRVLDLANNKIESLPDEDTWTGICSTLEMLDLSFNKLTSIEELAGLSKLSQLKVDANQLTSLKGVSWGELKQITMISAVGNQIAELSQEIENAPSLEYVELSENKITVLPLAVSDLKKLKSFNIAGNPIKDPKVMKAAEKGVKDLRTYVAKVGGAKGKK